MKKVLSILLLSTLLAPTLVSSACLPAYQYDVAVALDNYNDESEYCDGEGILSDMCQYEVEAAFTFALNNAANALFKCIAIGG